MITNFTTQAGLFNHLDTGQIAEITEEIYNHFMEVLPPLDFSSTSFILREGAGDSYRFSKIGNSYYARVTQADILTKDYVLCMIVQLEDPRFILDDEKKLPRYTVLKCLDELSFLQQYKFSLISDLKKIAELYSDKNLNPETFLADANIVSYIHQSKAQ